MGDDKCTECSANTGQLHKYGCDLEICPFCRTQLVSCDCTNNLMDIVLNRTDADKVDCFSDSEKKMWVELIGDLKFKWQEVLDSPYQTYDMYFDLPPESCVTKAQLKEFKRITKLFLKVDEELDCKFEQLCNEKGRIPFTGYGSD